MNKLSLLTNKYAETETIIIEKPGVGERVATSAGAIAGIVGAEALLSAGRDPEAISRASSKIKDIEEGLHMPILNLGRGEVPPSDFITMHSFSNGKRVSRGMNFIKHLDILDTARKELEAAKGLSTRSILTHAPVIGLGVLAGGLGGKYLYDVAFGGNSNE